MPVPPGLSTVTTRTRQTSVVRAWQKKLGVDPTKVDINGGAIVIGHQLGGPGA